MAKHKPNLQLQREIGKRLRNARKLMGISHPDAEHLLGLSKGRLACLEAGFSVLTVTEAIEMAEYYNTTVAYIVGEEEYGEPIRGFMGQIPFRVLETPNDRKGKKLPVKPKD